MKKILITGCAGFIGFHAALKLKNSGYIVYGLDNFNDYYDQKLKESRAEILAKEDILVKRGDILDESLLYELCKKNEISHILHLAAQAGVRYSLENPSSYIDNNIRGFLNILELCRKIPSIKLVYASSSSVYGLNEITPYDTDAKTDRPASLYGATKKSNELMAHSYHHLFGIKCIGLRFFTVYGPWGRPDMAYFSFTKDILEEKPIKIFNHGNVARDYTYIDDIVEGVLAALEVDIACDVFNLGNKQPKKVMELVQLIEQGLNKKAILHYLPMQAGDVLSTCANVEKSEQQLSYYPKTQLEKGVTNFLAWFNNYHQSNKLTIENKHNLML